MAPSACLADGIDTAMASGQLTSARCRTTFLSAALPANPALQLTAALLIARFARSYQMRLQLNANVGQHSGLLALCLRTSPLTFMLRRLPFSQVARAERAHRRIDAHYRAEIEAASKRGDHKEVEALRGSKEAEERLDSDERDISFTKELIREAVELRVPLPTHPGYPPADGENEYWAFSQMLGQRYLTPLGVSTLRDTIRREREARRAARDRWIPWISALTGLIGALTGLAAILLS